MAAAPLPPNKLVLEPNVPQIIALKFRTGKEVRSQYSETPETYFTLVDGRGAYFSQAVTHSIANLELGEREPFYICKYWNGDKRQAPRINVWLTPDGEKARIAQNTEPAIPAEEPPSELEQQLARSLAEIQARKRGEQLAAQRASAPAPALPAALQGWSAALLDQTNALIDVYAQACKHAESLHVPAAVVRTVMISAFIGLQRTGGNRG
jgi:hypothetical protein